MIIRFHSITLEREFISDIGLIKNGSISQLIFVVIPFDIFFIFNFRIDIIIYLLFYFKFSYKVSW